jgi:hypothetical protein
LAAVNIWHTRADELFGFKVPASCGATLAAAARLLGSS